MIPTLQTFFGLTLRVSNVPIAPAVARALAKRLQEVAHSFGQHEVPVAQAAEIRRDAERYLGMRRMRELRLPTAVESTCDDHAWALMRLTANTPPRLHAPERLVA